MPGARSTVAGATAGAIRLVLKSGSRDSAPRPTSFFCNTNEVNKMAYVIAFTVVAMMGLYVVIIGRCLREPEWQ
jgi:hypothetical protein